MSTVIRFWLDGKRHVQELSNLHSSTLDRILNEGVFLTESGAPMSAAADRRMKIWLTGEDPYRGTSDYAMNAIREGASTAPRWLIPGLWPWGTIPMLTGQPKAGKTHLGTELGGSLAQPGRRFLKHFDPAQLPMDAEIWIINAEQPALQLEDALDNAGAFQGEPDISRRRLRVEHLELLGGASIFDLTNAENFDAWASHFIECLECYNTGNFAAPSVVIVDGLTAILRGNTDRYGEWYPRFRELMRYVDIPNALVIGHSTLKGDHSMGGTEALAGPDGLWTYTRNGRGRRYFSVTPRMGGAAIPATPIGLDESGRLMVISPESSRATDTGSAPASDQKVASTSIGDLIMAFVRERNEEDVEPRISEIRAGVGGDSKKVDQGVKQLMAEGQLLVRDVSGRGGTAKHYRIGQDPLTPVDGENIAK